MARRFLIVALACVAGLGVVACEKVGDGELSPGDLAYKAVQFSDAIPVEYDELITVDTNHVANTAALWFRGADETLTVVWVNLESGTIDDQVLLIPRR